MKKFKSLVLGLAGSMAVLSLLAAGGQAISQASPVVHHPVTAIKGHFENAPATTSCSSGFACGWANANFGNGPGMWQQANPDFHAFDSNGACNSQTAGQFSNGTWNDCISSLKNSSGNTFFWFANDHCPGGAAGALTETNGEEFTDLVGQKQENGNTWNDVISSDNVNSTNSC